MLDTYLTDIPVNINSIRRPGQARLPNPTQDPLLLILKYISLFSAPRTQVFGIWNEIVARRCVQYRGSYGRHEWRANFGHFDFKKAKTEEQEDLYDEKSSDHHTIRSFFRRFRWV